ncbi:MAG: class I SAM-dependent methyltransferase [Candidatus Omnitrophota bacterium]|nr:class I SAM-dependent methyltransferase [Candidatus Omnitrophota bacterium]
MTTTTSRGASHWERLYTTKALTQLSWYQAKPTMSLELIAAAGIGPDDSIVDVGGGASTLVDHLLDQGYRRLVVLDLSAAALQQAQRRLGERANQVTWLQGDVTEMALPQAKFALWHDRAVFHFFTDSTDRKKYVQAATRALAPGGHVVMGTFALGGPESCSGLEVVCYSPAALHDAFGREFELVERRDDIHLTPLQMQQPFLYARLRKRV